MIFLTAGHNPKGPNPDPGACANNYREADLTIQLRDLTSAVLRNNGQKLWNDSDADSLSTVVSKLKTGNGSVICEIHFNAGPPTATGVEVIVPTRSTIEERELAESVAKTFAETMSIRNRGVITESQTRHGRLAIMRPEGINILIEVCFITSKSDLQTYFAKKEVLANKLAELLTKADAKII